VNDAVNVAAGPDDFGVQRIFEGCGKIPSQTAALGIDENYVGVGNLVKSPAACF